MHSRELVSMFARADVALHELVGDVVVLGQQLAGHVERHRLGAVRVDAAAELARDGRGGLVPATRARRAPADAAAGPRGPAFRRARCPSRTACRDWRDAPDRRAPRRRPCAAVASTPQPTPQYGTGSSSGRGLNGYAAAGESNSSWSRIGAESRAVGDQLAQPRRLARVAEQHGAAHLVALEHHALVDAAALVGEHQRFAVRRSRRSRRPRTLRCRTP